MALTLYAGTSVAGLTALPSPISLKPTKELIWSENTGRSGGSKAKMVGDVIAEKMTYAIEWDMLTASEFNNITSHLTKNFFYFAVGTSRPSTASKYYRSEISYEMVQVGASDIRYRNVAVSVIQQ